MVLNVLTGKGGAEFLSVDGSYFTLNADGELSLTPAAITIFPYEVVLSPVELTVPEENTYGLKKANGQAISRAGFPVTFAKMGVIYGPGDGATTFNLPPYRGRFIRVVDDGAGVDPDAASRSDRGDGTGGDNVGSKQGHQLADHGHRLNRGTGTSSSTTTYMYFVTTYVNNYTGFSTGGNENRSINIYLHAYIRVS